MKNLLYTMNNMLRKFFVTLFPLAYIFYILYVRTNPRPPRNLLLHLSIIQIIIALLIIFINSFRIYSLLKTLGIIQTTESKNKYVFMFMTFLRDLAEKFNSIWIDFFRLILDKFFVLNLYMVKCIKHLYTFISPKGFYVILFCDIMPRVFVVSLFLIEIFFFQKLRFFYISLILLLMPLCIKLVDKIIMQFYEDNYPGVRDALFITETIHAENKKTYTFEYSKNYEKFDFVENIEDFVYNHYVPLKDIPNLVNTFKRMRNKFKYDYIDIIIAIMYIIGWSRILYLGFVRFIC